MTRESVFSALSCAIALAFGLITAQLAYAQPTVDCGELIDGQIKADCEQANAGDVVVIPVGKNTEGETRPITNTDGFSISLDGIPIDSDPTLEDRIRQTDIALADADVRVTFDGFDPKTRLSVETVGAPRAYALGDTVTLQSELNYPAFIERSEFRIVDRRATGGARLIAIVPVEPNGRASFTVPEGRDVVVVHRVYDARGRFDQTTPLPLSVPDGRGLLDDVEEGADTIAVSNIRVNGGTITVSATNIAQGATLRTLGEIVRPDSEGRLVIQRILPPGHYAVDVAVNGGLRNTRLTRDVEIPSSEWFTFGVADLTYSLNRIDGATDSRTTARLQFYADGTTASGYNITGSIDTTEEEFRDLFRRLDEKDPRSVLDRIDPEDSYPTFGDDSTIEDTTPTSGRVYLRVERDGNFALFGDYQSRIAGSAILRNERTLYGVQGYYASQDATEDGDPRFQAELYGAEPDQLVGREVFRGTGASVYFLRRQDVFPGTETITIEIRDADSNRVIDRQLLIAGEDYDVNYLLGVVTLTRPLTGELNENLIVTNPGGDELVNLVVQYEFTPTLSDVDGFSFGGRIEGWITDNVRLGLTGLSDNTGDTNQTAVGVDLRYEFGDNSFAQLDYAQTFGPGFDQDFSINGGLTIDGSSADDGDGEAFQFEIQGDLQDLGYNRAGVVGGYFEHRTDGFSSLDFQVTGATGDETLYGAFLRVDKTEELLGYSLYADIYENDVGSEINEVGVEVTGNLSPRLAFEVAAEYLDETTGTTDGNRFDLAVRLEYAVSDRLTFSAFGQGTASSSGLEDYNLYGVGVAAGITENWSLEAEVYNSSLGGGGRLLANYQHDGSSAYFGYQLDRGRGLDAGVPRVDDGGTFLAGGRNKVNGSVYVYGETQLDLFDDARTLTNVYGVEYVRSDFLRYDASVDYGQVNDDLERTALSFGVRFDDEVLRASARMEFRQDNATAGSEFDDLNAIYLDANARYEIDEERRLILDMGYADAASDTSSVLAGRIIDAVLGYAYRPVKNERLNVLARLRYLEDTFGQSIDGVAGAGDQQRSAVFSVEANYDLNRNWTIGAKLGGRLSETNDGTGWIDNDAFLAVANARYNLVHNWDVLVEARYLDLTDVGSSEASALGAVYRQFGNNTQFGVGYNFGSFSDDLTDIEQDDRGIFLNVVVNF
ncbi:hypothetical protein N9L47_03650 [Rhodobacteraceae bacterium]|nr:hypothetical protein [Paracoccaceae bacterium]